MYKLAVNVSICTVINHNSMIMFLQFIEVFKSSCSDHAFKSPPNSLHNSPFLVHTFFLVDGVAFLSACVTSIDKHTCDN
jgi:hypothetical protein